MAELDEEELAVAAPEPEEEITDLNGAVRGVTLGASMGEGYGGMDIFGMMLNENGDLMVIIGVQ